MPKEHNREFDPVRSAIGEEISIVAESSTERPSQNH